jgi:hypothetical protein
MGLGARRMEMIGVFLERHGVGFAADPLEHRGPFRSNRGVLGDS